MKSDILKWPKGSLDFTHKPLVMGILNVTPDSFSDGGENLAPGSAVRRALQMQSGQAAIIDIGAESSRPGSEPVDANTQIKRAVPVIEQLADKLEIPISIDTYHPEVAKAAINAGASIINDITGCENEQMIALAAEKQVPVILMHMQGRPKTMQQNPDYENVTEEVLEFLLERAEKCQKAGIAKQMLILDPGIGFGKSFDHNIQLLKNIEKFTSTDYRILLGTSRKRFLGAITGKNQPKDRLYATLATTALAAFKNVGIVRVHDVDENADVIKVCNRIQNSVK